MAGRWVLERAGIINVYQYGDETLHFGGGRLLLRGVNGSGKSTAMNMLLPFLLDADTRRIDAAGEQSGVLKSWMLSGREEQQPQGYLWVEFGRRAGDPTGGDLTNGDLTGDNPTGDGLALEHLTVGCGIRANRSTDRVTTWWFVTQRRPGIDVALVEDRQPLSADALRAVLEPGAVYRDDQRQAYRAEVRARLYGGADLDQHLRLLHVVRNPRVGDRIDVDLPQYLHDALPQLSDDALDDAAQPLEDLEEHRRNVDDLDRTATALAAIHKVYRGYARTELRRAAEDALALADGQARLARAERRAQTDAEQAAGAREQAAAARVESAALAERLDDEIRSLEASDAYKAGAELNDLREHVATLAEQVSAAEEQAERGAARTRQAEVALATAQRAADADQARLAALLGELAADAASVGLTERPPDAPVIAHRPLRADGSPAPVDPFDDEPVAAGVGRQGPLERVGTLDDEAVAAGVGGQGPPAPVDPFDDQPIRARVGAVRAARNHRGGDVRSVREVIAAVDRAEAELQRAEGRHRDAIDDEQRAREAFTAAREAWQSEGDDWRHALDAWSGRLAEHRHRHLMEGRAVDLPADHEADAAADHHAITDGWRHIAEQTIDEHRRAHAGLDARRAAQQDGLDALAARLAELADRVLPEPPTAPWQRRAGAPCLAELVDFSPHLDVGERAGLEAALEASGLLSAEVAVGGGLVLADGQLVARHDGPASGPSLESLLTVTVTPEWSTAVDPKAVLQVLEAISVSPDAAGSTPPGHDDEPTTVVTTDGRFRVGLLHGRHHKDDAEHIGLAARRAALHRQQAEAAEAVALAEAERDALVDQLATVAVSLDEAVALRRAFPPTGALEAAGARNEHAEIELAQARIRLDARQAAYHDAERAHAARVEDAERAASSLGLPLDRAQLDVVDATLTAIGTGCDLADAAATALGAAVTRWIDAGTAWSAAADDQAHSQANLRQMRHRHDRQAARLATLEDTIGADYDAVVRAIAAGRAELEHAVTERDLAAAREVEASGRAATAAEQHRRSVEELVAADERCVAELPHLRAVLAVPGLVAAACAKDGPDATDATDATETTDAADPPGTGAGSDGDTGSPADDLPTVAATAEGLRALATAVSALVPTGTAAPGTTVDRTAAPGTANPATAAAPGAAAPGTTADSTADTVGRGPRGSTVDGTAGAAGPGTSAEGVRQSLRQRRDSLGAGWDAEDHQPDDRVPLHIEVTGPLGRMPLPDAARRVGDQLAKMTSLLSAKQDQALRNLLQGLVAREVAQKLHAAGELVGRMNQRLDHITTSHGIGVSLRWRRRDDLDPALAGTVDLLAKPPDLRTADEDQRLIGALSERIADARRDDPELPYRDLIAGVLDYREWHRMTLVLHRPGRSDERLTRRTALSEGEKKMVSYLPLFAAVAASCDALAEGAPDAPRFVLLDDAFAKVSEDNHAKLFGLLVELDLDFIATSERLWGTHHTVPELAITEVIRDADLATIVLEHSRWNGVARETA